MKRRPVEIPHTASASAIDRRIDKRSLNIGQRVFDALQAKPRQTQRELALALSIHELSIESAIRRLRLVRAVTAECADRIWRYSLAPGAQRPTDRRGGKKQMAQEVAA